MTRDVVCGANVELQGALVFRPQCRALWKNLGIFRLRWCNGGVGILFPDWTDW